MFCQLGASPAGSRSVHLLGSGGFHGLYMEPLMPTLAKLRLSAFHRQNGRCFYCHLPMWTADPLSFAAQYGLSAAQARRFQCTAEHLIARQDGGKDQEGNVVAACLFCNRARHQRKNPPDPDRYCALVAKRIIAGRWHWPEVLMRLGERAHKSPLSANDTALSPATTT